jgi:hypothetical protein
VKACGPVTGLSAAVFLLLAAGGCRDRAEHPKAPEAAAAARRDAALASARVWFPPSVPPARVDFSQNTPGPGGFDPDGDVDCTFSLEPISGLTPKFICLLPDGEHVKVKYGEAVPNGEVSAEIAATRLLTALGFPTDRMNKVHSVRCHGCPPLPQQALQCLGKGEPARVCLQGAAADKVVTFQTALIERPIEGDEIEATKDQGWSWYELDKIDSTAGGSSRAEVDALRLMAVLLAHWDNKGSNQKLLCPPGQARPDGSCGAPVAAIGDLGGTFGPARVDLPNWERTPVWLDPAACTVSMKTLPFNGGTFNDQQISESGRTLALKLLHQLSPEQLDTLFEASGVTTFPHIVAGAKEPRNWTKAFLDKVNQIAAAGPCK